MPAQVTHHGVVLSSDRIADFCRKHRIGRLAPFGSILRDDFGPDSDVDVLVEFEPGHVPGFNFFAIEEELSAMMGRRVDLHTTQFLSPLFRDRIAYEEHYVSD